ncbi:MAG: c-type cytochrome, partial [Blastocatellia bacterium]
MRFPEFKILFALAASLLFAALLLPAASARQTEDSGGSAAGLFRQNCAVCHGETGKGAVSIPGLPNFTDPKFQASHSDERMASSISNGRDEMPAFGD